MQLCVWLWTLEPAFCAENVLVAKVPYGFVPGYLDNVDDEVPSEPQEMILMEKPSFLNKPSIHDQIFNSTLSNEFLWKYQQTFGKTEAEQNYYLTSQQGYYNSPTGLTATQQDDQRRAFAEYMMKRLAEFHTENIMKTDPQFKKVYEVKQAVSNFEIKAGPQTKLDLTYSFVGNFATGTFINPVANLYASINMSPSAYIPGQPQEVSVIARRSLTTRITAETGYTLYDKAAHFLVTRAFTPTISGNVSETIHMTGTEVDITREGLSLVGCTVIF